MKPFTLAALALGIGMLPLFSQGAPAFQPRPRPEDAQNKRHEHMDKALALTDAQKASVEGIRAKHKEAMEAKRHAAQDSRKAFAEAIRKPETKVEDIKTLHRAMADANLEMLLEGRSMRQEIRAVLTPEQREKAAFLMGRQEGMMHGHRGGFPGEGGR